VHPRLSKSQIFEEIFLENCCWAEEIRRVGVANLAVLGCVLRGDD